MPKAKFEAPDLSNATPEFLVDEMAKLSLVENYAKKMRAFYKEALYARANIVKEALDVGVTTTTTGEKFYADTVRTCPMRMDTTALKDDKPEIYEQYLKEGDQLTTRFRLKEGVENPIVNDLINQIKAELDLD